MDKQQRAFYDKFIRSGLAVGFTDDQIDFLWMMIFEEKYPTK